jgi:hypothetical protein
MAEITLPGTISPEGGAGYRASVSIFDLLAGMTILIPEGFEAVNESSPVRGLALKSSIGPPEFSNPIGASAYKFNACEKIPGRITVLQQ